MSDAQVGLVAGPVAVTRAGAPPLRTPVVTAVAASAALAMAATGVRAVLGDPPLLLGLALPPVLLVAVIVAQLLGRAGERRFTVRTTAGRSVDYTLSDDGPADALRHNDIVRVTTGRDGGVRTVEVLAGLNGPAVRRLTARPALGPVAWLGYAAAALLVIVAGWVLLGAG
ncbi:hypothetical protein Ade02nite_00210 [Paractinoplanes deccanensis]|uniref:PH domain-containing protein n=1 Tax=Paractinoplanes deccanensis TaxID=113561 RepID=A0ABQ3XUF4_9ACTN|nr:hypothetical protein [Actinoplanes deccanensis]GID71380.1 hypothetical protein Ade02nite_00210 [Actinoplanes deccanensis]